MDKRIVKIFMYNGKSINFDTIARKFFVGNVWIRPKEGFNTIKDAKKYIDIMK